eukprot:11193081-Alexandrium_andersonii.AAC.1
MPATPRPPGGSGSGSWVGIVSAHAPGSDPFHLTPDLIFKTVAVLSAAVYRSAAIILSGAKLIHSGN